MQRERRPTLAARGSANECQGTNFVWVAKRKLLSHHSPIGNADYADRGVFKLVKQRCGIIGVIRHRVFTSWFRTLTQPSLIETRKVEVFGKRRVHLVRLITQITASAADIEEVWPIASSLDVKLQTVRFYKALKFSF